MSKFMGLGFSLEQVFTMATHKTGCRTTACPNLAVFKSAPPGDVATLEVVEGPVSFVLHSQQQREGRSISSRFIRLLPGAVRRPYNAPFAVR